MRLARKREALAQARQLLHAAAQGDRGAAEVLMDVVEAAGGEPELAENLAFALRGLAHKTTYAVFQPAGLKEIRRGAPLPPDAAGRARQLAIALDGVRARLFPPRAAPCLPNRRDVVRLVQGAQHEPPLERRLTRELWEALQGPCGNYKSAQSALRVANDVLRGNGVERIYGPGFRGGGDRRYFDYVNLGDTYDPTLLYDYHASRFRVTSWGDLVDAWERRWGCAEAWERRWGRGGDG